jgi:hypothetical protein
MIPSINEGLRVGSESLLKYVFEELPLQLLGTCSNPGCDLAFNPLQAVFFRNLQLEFWEEQEGIMANIRRKVVMNE